MPDEPAPQELAQRLAVLIGTIMEDEVLSAVSIMPRDTRQISERLTRLKQAGTDIVTLAAAAEVITRRCWSMGQD